ncbi:Oidioi.mRNA.OKI2018_I69.chr2.g7008.t1.cds [Oikopleura dioica]|uniref:Oidioi.mRNA.OKI2018_I69.chr2.g7008.t1.cds n=1 Tax=Oikopleura dioica TaxID=34765 RepID=A0ABN7TBT7_OIKDI|nr:Oidioi.mRNA.OKI2018_I69.chr2.g7008.t1.cds [Oikopleura dioica]
MFEPYGKIQELQVLRNFNGTSRRCAFLTFSSRLEAQSAVQALNNTMVSSNCSQAMVVKLADTPKQKEKRKLERQLKSCAMQLQRLCADEDDLVGKLLLPSLCNLALSSTKLPSSSPAQQSFPVVPINQATGYAQNKNAMRNGWNNNNDNGGSTGNASDDSTKSSNENPTIGGTQSGPEGANLFVYHLPKRFNDSDLYALFSTIGELISAKVYVDRHTQESKCFGFVSYKHIIDASAAIKRFNTYQVDDKRLKVEMKKPRQKTTFKPTPTPPFPSNFSPPFIPDVGTKSATPPIWGPHNVEPPFFTSLLE